MDIGNWPDTGLWVTSPTFQRAVPDAPQTRMAPRLSSSAGRRVPVHTCRQAARHLRRNRPARDREESAIEQSPVTLRRIVGANGVVMLGPDPPSIREMTLDFTIDCRGVADEIG
jgi:hypothetical protein